MATRVRIVLKVPNTPPMKGKEALKYLVDKTANIPLTFRRRWPMWRKAMAMAQHIEGASLHIFREARGTKGDQSKYWRMLHPAVQERRPAPLVGQAAPQGQHVIRTPEDPYMTTVPVNGTVWQAFWQNGEITWGQR